jgi:hypothetical protein
MTHEEKAQAIHILRGELRVALDALVVEVNELLSANDAPFTVEITFTIKRKELH